MNIKNIADKINLFNQDKCPTCGTSFSTKKFENTRSQLVSLKDKKEEENTQLKERLKHITSDNKIVMEYINKIQAATQKIHQAINQLNSENLVI